MNDENILGAHLFIEHRKSQKSDFNSSYKFDVLVQTDPTNLRKTEQFYISKLNTVYPLGLNNINSVSGS